MSMQQLTSKTSGRELWSRYREYLWSAADPGVSLDVSRVRFDDGYLARSAPAIGIAMESMQALEAGALANHDEGRMVGHYWLRAPQLAPIPEAGASIRQSQSQVRDFAARVHSGDLHGAHGPFEHVVHIGIGGSTNGPQLLCDALAGPTDRVAIHFIDNVDPEGIIRLVERLDGALGRTLVALVSKSGITPTPCYAATVLQGVYERRGLNFARHAVATTMEGTPLDKRVHDEGWLAQFPMWDWVGGRTSVTSAVGLLPAALQGIDTEAFLSGAAAMDRLTRVREARRNPAALLALMWHWLGNGHGAKRMVVLPYRDRLALLPKYVQQLVMESVGKRSDRAGNVVHQGLTVYGNKGSSDQHSYMQQLRDGAPDFFVTFVTVEGDRDEALGEVEPGCTLGDVLFGSWEGTRNALYQRGRDSIVIVLRALTPSSLGALIALYERAVGLYAELVDLNAYHQPGVDKHSASAVTSLQRSVIEHLRRGGEPYTVDEIADALDESENVETIYKLLKRLAASGTRGVTATDGGAPFEERFAVDREA
jgi:glucose-6-phosphate isomerase